MCEQTKLIPARMTMEVVPRLVIATTKRRLILVLDTIFENEEVHFGGVKDDQSISSSQIFTRRK